MEKITWNPEGARRSDRSSQSLNRPIAHTPDSNIRRCNKIRNLPVASHVVPPTAAYSASHRVPAHHRLRPAGRELVRRSWSLCCSRVPSCSLFDASTLRRHGLACGRYACLSSGSPQDGQQPRVSGTRAQVHRCGAATPTHQVATNDRSRSRAPCCLAPERHLCTPNTSLKCARQTNPQMALAHHTPPAPSPPQPP